MPKTNKAEAVQGPSKPKPVILKTKKKPLIIQKNAIYMTKNNISVKNLMLALKKNKLTKVKSINVNVLYKTSYFSQCQAHQMVIYNRLENNSFTTYAAYTDSAKNKVIKSSKKLCNLIGFENYERIFNSLNLIANEEAKYSALLALLTIQDEVVIVESGTQTDESCINVYKEKKRKRVKRQVYPVVVKTGKSITEKATSNTIKENNTTQKRLVTAPGVVNEDSNMSISSVTSNALSISSDILQFAESNVLKSITNEGFSVMKHENTPQYDEMDNVNEVFSNHYFPMINLWDGTKLSVPIAPTDIFHMAVPEIMRCLTKDEQKKLLKHQAYIDYKYCMDRDEDNNLLVHLAVINNDHDLVRRQCAVLKIRGETPDITAGGVTPLQMSITCNASQNITKLLLQKGANPLLRERTDNETDSNDNRRERYDYQRSALHFAAEMDSEHFKIVFEYIICNYRSIILQNEDLFPNVLSTAKTEDELKTCVFECIATMHDSQGYTPLMLAVKNGNTDHVRLFLEHYSAMIDYRMPNSGDTALHIAVSAVVETPKHMRQVFEKHLRTVELLLTKGAKAEITNHSGQHVLEMLVKFNVKELSNVVTACLSNRFSDKPHSLGIVANIDGSLVPLDISTCANKIAEKGVVVKRNTSSGILNSASKIAENGVTLMHNKLKCGVSNSAKKTIISKSNAMGFRPIAAKPSSGKPVKSEGIVLLSDITLKQPHIISNNINKQATTASACNKNIIQHTICNKPKIIILDAKEMSYRSVMVSPYTGKDIRVITDVPIKIEEKSSDSNHMNSQTDNYVAKKVIEAKLFPEKQEDIIIKNTSDIKKCLTENYIAEKTFEVKYVQEKNENVVKIKFKKRPKSPICDLVDKKPKDK